jgi:hypothetical protein
LSDIEFSKYGAFVEKHFPNSPVPNTKLMRDIYDVIQNNIEFMDLIRQIDIEGNEERDTIYQTFYLLNIRTLYHMPSNDQFVNGIIIRAIVENLFRLSVSLLKCQIVDLKEASFSTLKTALESKGFQHRYKDFYECLCNNFGTYSKDVHGEYVHKLSEQEFLISIRTTENVEHLKRILKVYKKINERMIPFFLKEIRTKKINLNAANLNRMLNIVGDSNYNTFYDK